MANYYWYSGYDGDEDWMVGTIHSASSLENAIKAAKADLRREFKDFAVISTSSDPSKITKKTYNIGIISKRFYLTSNKKSVDYCIYSPKGSKKWYYLDEYGKRVVITPELAMKLHVDYDRINGRK